VIVSLLKNSKRKMGGPPVHQHGSNECCGSEIFIPDPDFFLSQIPYETKKRKSREKKIRCFTFLDGNYLIF
jgi:hypothetical protein